MDIKDKKIDILYHLTFVKDDMLNYLLHEINKQHPEMLDKDGDLYKKGQEYISKVSHNLDLLFNLKEDN